MQVVTADMMRRLDARTCETQNITGFQLMQRACEGLFEAMRDNGYLSVTRPLILAGPGNNGGDGLGLAKHLKKDHPGVRVVYIGTPVSLQGEALKMYEHVKGDVDITFVQDVSEFRTLSKDADMIIDALFGIGVNSPVRAPFDSVIEWINTQDLPVLSIDIPSGLNADNGLVEGIAVDADATFVIQHFKAGNLLQDALDYSGEHIPVDIGILDSDAPMWLEEALPPLRKRRHNTHKYDYGALLTIGGSKGMTGAPTLAAEAAIRSGAGLSTIAAKKAVLPYLPRVPYELMWAATDDVHALMKAHSAVVFGPGLGRDNADNRARLSGLLERDLPLLIDADGLYYLAGELSSGRDLSHVVLTPHAGELARLFGISPDEVARNPLYYIDQLVARHGVHIVLKGPCTIIAGPEGKAFSTRGNPGMATAGSGDVLSGIIGRFLAEGYAPFEAMRYGVRVHGLAGDLAQDAFGEESLNASDIITMLPEAMRNI